MTMWPPIVAFNKLVATVTRQRLVQALVAMVTRLVQAIVSMVTRLVQALRSTVTRLVQALVSLITMTWFSVRRRVTSSPSLYVLSLLVFVQVVIYLYLWRSSGRYTLPPLLNRSKYRSYRSIIYIKTHKTGSSTLARILYGYGVLNGLNFAQEPDREMFTDDILVPSKLLPSAPWEPYHIICQHFTYNKNLLRSFMPRRSFTFTSMRDPVDQFMSAYNYLGINIGKARDIKHANRSNDELVYQFVSTLWDKHRSKRVPEYRMFMNSIAYDLGFTDQMMVAALQDPSSVRTFIRHLDDSLDLVILQEEFDQGLLKLKTKLGWSMSNIYYLKENVNTNKFIRTGYLSKRTRDMILRLNFVDVMLYDYFKKRYSKRLSSTEEEELTAFRALNEDMYTQCVCGVGTQGLFKSISYEPCQSTYFNFQCRTLITDTMTYSFLVSERQKQFLSKKPKVHPAYQDIEKRAKDINSIWKNDLTFFKNLKNIKYP